MSTQPSPHHLDVPGGRLYYEVRGSGPLLLVIGQPMTSGPFGPLADLLADDHTVVTYDPRGLGASTIEDPSRDVTPEIEAEDLACIIDAVGGEKADVFASSGGAIAALAFAARHPDKAGTVIAHEPPIAEMLADAPQIRAAVDDVEDAYRAYGAGAAWGKFVSLVMHQGRLTETGVTPAAWPPAGDGREDTQPHDGEDADVDRNLARAIGETAGRRRTVLPPHVEAFHPLPTAGRGTPLGRPASRRRSGRGLRRRDRAALGRGAGRTARNPTSYVRRRPWRLHGRPRGVRSDHPAGADRVSP